MTSLLHFLLLLHTGLLDYCFSWPLHVVILHCILFHVLVIVYLCCNAVSIAIYHLVLLVLCFLIPGT